MEPSSLRELPMTPKLRAAVQERRRERRRLAAAQAKGMVGVGAVGFGSFGSLALFARSHNNIATLIFMTMALLAFFGLLHGVRDLRRVRPHLRRVERSGLDRDLLDATTGAAAASPATGGWWTAHTAASAPVEAGAQHTTAGNTSR